MALRIKKYVLNKNKLFEKYVKPLSRLVFEKIKKMSSLKIMLKKIGENMAFKIGKTRFLKRRTVLRSRKRYTSPRPSTNNKTKLDIKNPKSILINLGGFLRDLFTTKQGWKRLFLAFVIFLGVIFGFFLWYAKDLPTPDKINARVSAQSTQIFDRNGKLLYEIHGDENRILAGWDEIPQNLKNATVAIEDRNFYKHSGFSAKRIIGSAILNVLQGSKAQGGSTITQQFVKNALLTNEKTYTRKIKELIISIEIEQMFKKDDILKMYLNEIPYGSNAYGAKVAAKTFFGKELKDLTLEECALLSALPQAPTYYSPYGNHKEDLLARKDIILDQMSEQGFITKEEAEKAKEIEIVFAKNEYGTITAPHFVLYVKEQLVEKYGEQVVNEGGLKVYTTLDLSKQQMAEEAVATNVDKNYAKYNASNASLVAIDPKTGQILAMVGSRDFFDEEIDGNVNVALQERQPGSSFKPFAYAAAWATPNWGPGSVVYDLKTDFGGGYIPNNYSGGFWGPVSMRTALQNSLNIPAVKTLYIAGMQTVLDLAHSMGITTLNDTSQYGLSLVLGAGEVKLLDMTTAYGVFANNGIKKDTTWMLKIEDSEGKTIDEYKDTEGSKILDTQVAYLMSNVLSDDSARARTFGAGGPLTISGRPAAAKTGTTNDYKDAWTMGYTPSLVAGVWAGNNDNSPMTKAGGSIAAAPIWHDFMTKALAGTAVEQFTKPSGVKTVVLDSITGHKPGPTSKTITDIFPSWYKIPEGAGVSQEIKIDKLSGKLATDKCPEELIETKVYNPITAEISSSDSAYSRWYGPILAWAQSQGYTTDSSGLPTEICDLHTGDDLPEINIISPNDGDVLGSEFDVEVIVEAPAGIMSVKVTVGGKTIEAEHKNGNRYIASFSEISSGAHEITATVKDSKYQIANEKIGITVEESST